MRQSSIHDNNLSDDGCQDEDDSYDDYREFELYVMQGNT